MKKVLLFILAFATALGSVDAKNKNDEGGEIEIKDPARFRPKYRNISFSSQAIGLDGSSVKGPASDFGVAFTTGRSYIVHPNPVAGMLRFGIDATWTDLNYGNWDKVHKLDVALGVGPGIHINPVDKLGIHTYFRYNPTATLMADIDGKNTNIMLGYSTYFTTGGAVSWGVISLGAEARFGGGELTSMKAGDEELELIQSKVKHKMSGYRVYVSFRF
jgi:hypothetical protein